MAELIHIGTDPHKEVEELLPWFVTGQLDAADRAKVENHLASCGACQLQVRFERRLSDEFRQLSPEIEAGWAQLRNRLQRTATRRSSLKNMAAISWQSLSRPVVGGLIAAQLAVVVLVAAFAFPLTRPESYRALGSAPVAAAANVIVMFRPDATERDMRGALNASGARLVGGPTSADAYLLQVAPPARASALARLRADDDVVMAEAIDGGAP